MYKTTDGYKVIVSHMKDGKPHFHIGQAKDINQLPQSVEGATKYFQTSRYSKFEVNHVWYNVNK